MIQAIVALDQNRGIATQDGMPWNLPKDRAYFKRKTDGRTVVMGYKTYLTLNRPLSNRQNIVLTSEKKVRKGFIACRSITELLSHHNKNLWVIGGQITYESLLAYTSKIYVTVIDEDFGCNRFFPEYDRQFSRTYKSRTYQDADLQYRYEVWERRL